MTWLPYAKPRPFSVYLAHGWWGSNLRRFRVADRANGFLRELMRTGKTEKEEEMF